MVNINKSIQNSKGKFSSLPFRKIAPNLVTMLALCAGITSIRYSIQADWSKAIICIFLAAFFDMLDGRVARMLKASSRFGAELDSLSDFVSFGISPSIMIYQWTLHDFPKFGWFFCLLYSIAMSMRLARFNTMLDSEPQPKYWQNFFVGVPAPAAAGLAILPVMLSFEFPDLEFIRSNWFMSALMFLVAFLMVSKIPTISTKKLKIPTYLLLPMMLLMALVATFMISQTWLTLSLLTLVYAISIPVGAYFFFQEKKQFEKENVKK